MPGNHSKGGKEKAAKYYAANKGVLKVDGRNKYRGLTEKQKDIKRKYQREKYHMNTDLNDKLKQCQRNYYASKRKNKERNKTLIFIQYKNE